MKYYKNGNMILFNKKQDNNIKKKYVNRISNNLIEIDSDMIINNNIEKIYKKYNHNIIIKKNKFHIVDSKNGLKGKKFILNATILGYKIHNIVSFKQSKEDNNSSITNIKNNNYYMQIEVDNYRYVKKNNKYFIIGDIIFFNKKNKQNYIGHIYIVSNNDNNKYNKYNKYQGYILLFKENKDYNNKIYIDIEDTVLYINKVKMKEINIKKKINIKKESYFII